MDAQGLTDIDLMALVKDDKPVAYLLELPLNAAEALAYMAYSTDVYSGEQLAILRAWRVKMTLLHGTWVAQQIDFD